MSKKQFNIHNNFSLQTNVWGQESDCRLILLLDNVIDHFYECLDHNLIPAKSVEVDHAKNKTNFTDCPEIFKLPLFNKIYLAVQDTYWSQYIYQFAHELCHHIINTGFSPEDDKFGWLEEAFCELASIYCLNEMSKTWHLHFPEKSFIGYSDSIAKYVNNILTKQENEISKPFKIWLNENINHLSQDRYKRRENAIVAIQLFPFFKSNPRIWRIIQYLQFVKTTKAMSLKDFLDAWEKCIPDIKTKKYITVIKEILLD